MYYRPPNAVIPMSRSILWSLLVVAGCGDNAQPADPLALTPLTDLDPDPSVVEVELVAVANAAVSYLPGTSAEVWAYRDGAIAGSEATIPGPILETNVGDHVIVHFRNELDEPTTIHWHGIRVPNDADGSEHTQTPVAPGGSYDYVFDTDDAGTFWYHPHIRGDVQLEKGLYGAVRVNGGTSPQVAADRVFVLDDVKLAADGSLDDSVDEDDIMLGRQGDTLLVNGHVAPVLEVAAGARERWRFVDAANGRFFKLSLPGHPFLVIGWDGGIIPAPYSTETLLIAPGERYEVIVDLEGVPGDAVTLQTLFYDRAPPMLTDPGPLDLMTVRLGDRGADPVDLPTTWATFETIPVDTNTPVQNFVFHEETTPTGERAFSINGERYPQVTPLLTTAGAVEIWRVQDDVGMDHPFHLHGMFFQVLDIDGVPVAHQGWKDTVIVPRYATLRFAVRYGEPGHWMYHCHILEHQERGMMGVLTVSAP